MNGPVLLDFRSALVNREGTGRAAREWVRALAAREDCPELRLFAWTWAHAAVPEEELGLEAAVASGRVRFLRRRLPHTIVSRALRLARRGIDDLAGDAALVQHLQLRHLPVRRAPQCAVLYDTLWNDAAAPWISADAAARMAADARALVRSCARIQAPSAAAGRDLVATLAIEPARLDVVPLGADHLLRVAPGAAPGTPFLFTAARVDARKNHITVLRALEQLARAGTHIPWVVAGPSGHGAEPFLRALDISPVRRSVQLVGALSEADLAAHYRAARLFVFPSLGEGFGLPPLEAMGLGTATLSSPAGSLGEVLAEGAVLLPPEDPAAWADTIDRLWHDPAQRAAWEERGRVRAALFTWDRAATALLDSWRRAALAPGSGAALGSGRGRFRRGGPSGA